MVVGPDDDAVMLLCRPCPLPAAAGATQPGGDEMRSWGVVGAEVAAAAQRWVVWAACAV